MSSAGIPLRQRSPHIDIVHLYKARGIENRHSAPCWHWSQNLGYWISMPKLNAPAEIHWRRSNMNTRDPILMKSVEVLKDCRSLNAAAEMNCPMPGSVAKVPIRNEKRCIHILNYIYINYTIHLFSLWTGAFSSDRGMGQFISSAAFKLRQSFRTSTDFIRIGSRLFIFDRRQWISAGTFNFSMDIQ